MKKDWRNTKWRDFSKEQKRWFIVMTVSLVVLLAAAGIDSANNINVPNWAALIIAAVGVVAVCKFVNLTPWALFGMNPTIDDDPEDEMIRMMKNLTMKIELYFCFLNILAR